MNIDTLKNIWDKEKIEITPEISLEKQKEIHSPLEKIRKNMKLEFWASLISLPLIITGVPAILKNLTSLLAIFLLIGVSAHYYLKFYTFYKKINPQNFKTYHNLLDLRYELVLNTELYKSYYLNATTIAIYIISLLFVKGNIIFSIASISIVILLLYVFGKIWLHDMYGKHIETISKLVAELNDEEDDFQYDRSFIKIKDKLSFLNKYQNYCQNKFGKQGNLIYSISVGFIFMAFLILISFSLGFLIGYLGLRNNLIQDVINTL